MAQTSLGRGLDALLTRKKMTLAPGVSSLTGAKDDAIVELPVHVIQTNAFQPRHAFNEEQLLELANSIREYGVIQPLVVSREGDEYHLIAGERRLRASKMIGLEKVPVVIRNTNEHEKLAVALIENVQRVDLNPIELGFAYKRLADEFSMSHDEIGARVGKSRPVVSNTIRLLNLPAVIQDAVREGAIQMAMARTILALPTSDEQITFFYKILEGKMTTNEAERQTVLSRGGAAKRNSKVDMALLGREEKLRERLGTKVTIEKHQGTGRISIYFYSDEELDELFNTLTT
ncbi:MAG: ParB/RepB/Spo0J family partition protein [Candidatus Uhrbacteria bacterium]|nr:ParB/RepB/Spo0J family partition protein [Candidatus Uhrbacteria bacterium]